MLIPSIDLMGGKIVQLVQGDKKALEFDDFEEWIARFSGFPLVQLIDLDAALGRGDNRDLLRQFAVAHLEDVPADRWEAVYARSPALRSYCSSAPGE